MSFIAEHLMFHLHALYVSFREVNIIVDNLSGGKKNINLEMFSMLLAGFV